MGKVIMRKRVELTDDDVDLIRSALERAMGTASSDQEATDYHAVLTDLEDVTEIAYCALGVLPL